MSLKTRTVAFLSVLALSVLPLAALACPSAADEGGATAEEAAAEYTIEATAEPVKVGAQGYALVTIKILGGYHWNKEYPAKATVANDGFTAIDLAKKEFKQTSGDFAAEETVATLKIPLTGKATGTETLKVDTRFGVCSDKVCLIKKASADVKVVVAE
ncbi:MAG: hypothetical protein EP329_19505 [Deltaproteobacteria bacterium]|nr:MAG: hypothetical protein EP329_19505 [Deltaproteobacteria bacterium]